MGNIVPSPLGSQDPSGRLRIEVLRRTTQHHATAVNKPLVPDQEPVTFSEREEIAGYALQALGTSWAFFLGDAFLGRMLLKYPRDRWDKGK
jgi:hypothetical protein